MLEESAGLFFLGLVTFLSPCSIALISAYLTYSVGVSKNILRGLVIGSIFAIAMCLVFFFLGYAVSSLIPIGFANSKFFYGVSGVLLILFGANNLGLFRRVSLSVHNERVNALKLNALTRFSRYNYVTGSFLFGIVISLAVGPCSLSLVLPAILLTIFSAPTPFHGGFLLLMFGLGHALPVVFLSTLLATTRKVISEKVARPSEWLTKIFGTAFIAIGLTMISYALGGW